jgi:hypothetical protein
MKNPADGMWAGYYAPIARRAIARIFSESYELARASFVRIHNKFPFLV